MKRQLFSTVTITFLLACASPAIAADQHGRLLASQCAQCHGTNGKSIGDMDRIAGKDLYNDLLEMKAKNKPEDIMHQQARGYTDEELRLIAEYFATVQ